jgi:membrane protease YdiL (CAAX protease family)
LFLLSLFVSITEETLFRGYALNFCLGRIGNKGSILLVSILFACSHFGNYAIAPYIITFLGGLVFAILSIRTKSLFPAITFHLVWNFSQMLISNMFVKKIQIFEISQIVILLIVLVLLKFGIFKNALSPRNN